MTYTKKQWCYPSSGSDRMIHMLRRTYDVLEKSLLTGLEQIPFDSTNLNTIMTTLDCIHIHQLAFRAIQTILFVKEFLLMHGKEQNRNICLTVDDIPLERAWPFVCSSLDSNTIHIPIHKKNKKIRHCNTKKIVDDANPSTSNTSKKKSNNIKEFTDKRNIKQSNNVWLRPGQYPPPDYAYEILIAKIVSICTRSVSDIQRGRLI